eukprot:4138004-Pleurochrysis_carterae.AAC.1
MWLAGYSTLVVGMHRHERWWSAPGQHSAWEHPRMRLGHLQRQLSYYLRYETPGTEARSHIEKSARAFNHRHFSCPTRRLLASPATRMDCCIVAANATCSHALNASAQSRARL